MTRPALTAPQFAALAGISRKTAWQAFKTRKWRGHDLIVHEVPGRGGRSGEHLEVLLDSLSLAHQEAWKARQTVFEDRSKDAPPSPDERRTKEYVWWLGILQPALAHKKRSPERAAALREIAAQKHHDWDGRPRTLTVKTLHRWIARRERGLRLSRKARTDKGGKRTFISRAWHKGVPFDDAIKAEILDQLKQEIRGLLKRGSTPKVTHMLARDFLMKATRAHGFRPNDEAFLKKICILPRALVETEYHYRKVDQFKRDRKAYEDSRPRFPRALPERPMEVVTADVHPTDIHLTRSDGSVATAKLLAFMDLATKRVWCELVFIEGRGGIRNVDVIEAFAAMCEHPAFGVPEFLLLDNGSEYLFAPYLNEALQLNLQGFSTRQSRIVRAMPYNPQAKPIEPFFWHLEGTFLSTLPGWIGGNRMNKRQGAVGKTVAPLGTFEDLKPLFYNCVAAYEFAEQGADSQLAGKSPAQAFRDHVVAGWGATVMSRDEVRAACAKTKTYRVSQGHFEFKRKEPWGCPELWNYPYDTVQVRVPAYHDPEELLLLDINGAYLGIARKAERLHPLDERGAKRSHDSAKARRAMIRALDESVPDVDPVERLATFVSEQTPVTPNPPKATVSFDPLHRPARMSIPGPKNLPSDSGDADDDEAIQALRELSVRNAKRMQSS